MHIRNKKFMNLAKGILIAPLILLFLFVILVFFYAAFETADFRLFLAALLFLGIFLLIAEYWLFLISVRDLLTVNADYVEYRCKSLTQNILWKERLENYQGVGFVTGSAGKGGPLKSVILAYHLDREKSFPFCSLLQGHSREAFFTKTEEMAQKFANLLKTDYLGDIKKLYNQRNQST